MRRLTVACVVVATLLTSCGGKEEPLGPTATVPQGTTTTNPYAIPPSSTRRTSTESSPASTKS